MAASRPGRVTPQTPAYDDVDCLGRVVDWGRDDSGNMEGLIFCLPFTPDGSATVVADGGT
jgi:hypothetical protein